MVIFGPIFHVGCRKASAAVTLRSASGDSARNGPPEAVRISRSTSAAVRPCRHWWMALCSLSTGSTATPRRRAASITTAPAMTSTSLFASAMVLPASIAARTASSAGGAGRGAQHDVHVGVGRHRDQAVAPRLGDGRLRLAEPAQRGPSLG